MTDLDATAPVASPTPISAPPPRRRRSRARGILVLFTLILLLAVGAAMAYKFKLIGHRGASSVTAINAPATPVPKPVPVAQPALTTKPSKPQAASNSGPASAMAASPAPSASPASANAAPTNPDRAKIAAMQAQIAQLSATVLADHADLVRLQASAANLPKLAARARRMALLAIATMALQSGQPLGVIPNAPEAVLRYARAAPPTEAGLRAQFATLAPRVASQAGMANSGRTGLWARLRAHVIDLISLRRGDQVLIGSRADGTLAVIRRDLALGDLTGAVGAAKSLPKPARAVLQSWLTQADHVLAARAALAQMAEQH